MTNEKIILFSSSSLYLSFPQYKAIISEFKAFKKVLININEPITSEIDDNYIENTDILQVFDNYIKLHPIEQHSHPIKYSRLNRFITCKNYKKYLTEYLYKISPDLIVSSSDLSLSSRVMFSWCSKNRVPYVILQPSFIEGVPSRYGLIEKVKYIIVNKVFGVPLYRKQNLYGNESQKSYLFLWGSHFIQNPKRKNLFILGNPAFDNLFRNFDSKRVIKNTVLICTENIDFLGNNYADRVNKIYLETIKAKPEIKFYIKVHPRESKEKYKILFPKVKFPNVTIVKDENLYDLFKLSDIQVSVASFSSFEAAAMGLPIIIVRPDNSIKFPNHFNEEIDIRVTKVEEVVNAINLALSNEYWKDFIEKRERYFGELLYSTDGQSAKRVVQIIKSLVSK